MVDKTPVDREQLKASLANLGKIENQIAKAAGLEDAEDRGGAGPVEVSLLTETLRHKITPEGVAAGKTRPGQVDSVPENEVPSTTRPSKKRGRTKNEKLIRLKSLIWQFQEEGLTYLDMCRRLGEHPRPPQASWQTLPWLQAYLNPHYKSAVKKWFSNVVAEKKRAQRLP